MWVHYFFTASHNNNNVPIFMIFLRFQMIVHVIVCQWTSMRCMSWTEPPDNFQRRLSTIRTLNIMEMDFFVCINFLLISSHLQFQIFLFQAIKPSLNPPGLRWNTQQETNPNEWMNNRERKNCSFRCFFSLSFLSILFFSSLRPPVVAFQKNTCGFHQPASRWRRGEWWAA